MWRTTLLLFWLGAACGHTNTPTPEPAAEPTPPAAEPAAEPVPAEEVVLTAPSSNPPVEQAPVTGSAADGAACLAASDCASGVCEGEGCTDDKPGVCAPATRSCTRDRRPYCGCDGETFFTSGSCPGQRFAARGMCTEQ